MNFHPIAEIFPLMSDADLSSLADDISVNGLRESIWTYKGSIIDGRNRFLACQKNGVEPSFREYTANENNLVSFVVSLNLKRRHMNESQRSSVAARLATFSHGGDRKSDQAANWRDVSQEQAAKLLNVGERSIQRAKKVLNEGVPELIQAVEQGEIAVSAASKIAELPKPEQEEILRKPFVANNSGENEWYTPLEFIEAARETMGQIDLDPASCELANKNVKAKIFYTKEDDGLTKKWAGKVWMNPPYASSLIGKFSEKICTEFKDNHIQEACILVNNATETKWAQQLLSICSAICFVEKRIKFIDKNGNPSGSPLQGQMIVYLGSTPDLFRSAFEKFGVVFHRDGGVA